jgi:hypothetical protein
VKRPFSKTPEQKTVEERVKDEMKPGPLSSIADDVLGKLVLPVEVAKFEAPAPVSTAAPAKSTTPRVIFLRFEQPVAYAGRETYSWAEANSGGVVARYVAGEGVWLGSNVLVPISNVKQITFE